jgi:carbamoylphosphate synthase large subunit
MPLVEQIRATSARRMAGEAAVRGLMNVQMAIKDGEVYIIEVNPRASGRCRSSARPSTCPGHRLRRR